MVFPCLTAREAELGRTFSELETRLASRNCYGSGGDMQSLRRLRQRCDELAIQRRVASERLAQERRSLSGCRRRVIVIEHSQTLIQGLAKQVQETAHKQIAAVVGRCIQSVFGEDYNFRIDFEKKRGKTEARMVFLKGEDEINPLKGSGGGLLDLAAFALRLACVLLVRPAVRRLLVIDEPLKHLDASRRPAVGRLLEDLSRELNIQIIQVTHDESLAVGKVVEI